jgi:hypothetical protein
MLIDANIQYLCITRTEKLIIEEVLLIYLLPASYQSSCWRLSKLNRACAKMSNRVVLFLYHIYIVLHFYFLLLINW